jgi:hypothetical protein
LELFMAPDCELSNPQMLLGALVRSRELAEITLLGSHLPSTQDGVPDASQRPLWTDADLKQLATLPKLEVLMISSAKLVDDGISALARCPNLRIVELDHSEIATSIGPLVGHPTIVDLRLQHDTLRPMALVSEAPGPSVRSLNFTETPITRDFDARMRSWCASRSIEYRPRRIAEGESSLAP